MSVVEKMLRKCSSSPTYILDTGDAANCGSGKCKLNLPPLAILLSFKHNGKLGFPLQKALNRLLL